MLITTAMKIEHEHALGTMTKHDKTWHGLSQFSHLLAKNSITSGQKSYSFLQLEVNKLEGTFTRTVFQRFSHYRLVSVKSELMCGSMANANVHVVRDLSSFWISLQLFQTCENRLL